MDEYDHLPEPDDRQQADQIMEERMSETKKVGLALLREPFPPNQISKLPKETKKQADDRKDAINKGNWPKKCEVCGGLHHEKAVHLDYVGHAALTDRLLDADPHWAWEPLALDGGGLPRFDESGGLWIRLTVCGQTRIGYGNAASKAQMDVGSREKEVIGDALRNAAMRFGAALDLWHKGDLHAEEVKEKEPMPSQELLDWSARMGEETTLAGLQKTFLEAANAARKYDDSQAEKSITERKDTLKAIIGAATKGKAA